MLEISNSIIKGIYNAAGFTVVIAHYGHKVVLAALGVEKYIQITCLWEFVFFVKMRTVREPYLTEKY